MAQTRRQRRMPAEGWQSNLRSAFAATAPGVVIAVARGDGAPEYLFQGANAAGSALTADTLFPVASITKLATALAALRLVAAGNLSLDGPVGHYLPESPLAHRPATVRDLFCHTAGLPGDLPDGAAPYRRGLDWPTLARACLAVDQVLPPRTLVSYTNLGPGLLAVIVERLTGQPFPDALSELVLSPLGIEGYLGIEPPRAPARIEGDYGEHAGTDLEPYNSAFWRSLGLPWGGLVTNAAGAIALLRAFRGQPAGFLPATLLAEATRDQTDGLPGEMLGIFTWPRSPWGLGPELRGRKEPHFVALAAPPDSFGHGGASGCVVWTDPRSDVTWFMHGMRTIESWMDSWPRLTGAILEAIGPSTRRQRRSRGSTTSAEGLKGS